MTASPDNGDGLDLANPDVMSEDELRTFKAFYDDHKKEQNLSYEFWLEFRPEVVKRHKARTATYYVGPPSAVSALTLLHQYVITAFPDGIKYEIELAANMGASRGDILDVISIAFIHSGHPGMYEVSRQSDQMRRQWPQDAASPYPHNWHFDPDAFRSGMDESSLSASPEDCAAVIGWYERVVGEVPEYVSFLAANRPDLLKTYRSRYEHAIKESLPAQMLPYLLLNYSVYRAERSGIRENLLLARALGLTKSQVLDSICSAVLNAGAEAFTLVQDVAGDLLDAFEEA